MGDGPTSGATAKAGITSHNGNGQTGLERVYMQMYTHIATYPEHRIERVAGLERFAVYSSLAV